MPAILTALDRIAGMARSYKLIHQLEFYWNSNGIA